MGDNNSDRTAVAAHGDAITPALVQAIVRSAPQVAAAVPVPTAAALGRWRGGQEHRARSGITEPDAIRALRELPSWLVERVHGALELTAQALPPVAGAGASLGSVASGRLGFASLSTEVEALREARRFAALRPGAVEVIAGLVSRLVEDKAVAAMLGADVVGDEEAVAAAHGAAYLAVAVVTAAAVLGDAGYDRVAAQLGVGLGTAAALLPSRSMPVVYGEAVLAKKRVEYLLPAYGHMQVEVRDHVFTLAEGPVSAPGGFADNGLVEVGEGGVRIRAGREDGVLNARLRVLAEPPADVETKGWDEVVEVSWPARRGDATLVGARLQHRRIATPPWPGDLRVRVHAYGRDDVDSEEYELVVWEAPAAPAVVHARADRLGHRLRGEPEPPGVDLPEAAYRWIGQSMLSEAATVTVVVGLSFEQVLQAFGADVEEPEPLDDLRDFDFGYRPSVLVSEVDGAVLAVEENGFRGAQGEVLAELSRGGRAASMFWNVNAVTRLSFARDGELLASAELGLPLGADPEVAAAIAGLDFDDLRDRRPKGLVAAERFTGRGLTVEDLDEIEEAGVGYLLAEE
ncbi:DUF6461 domain-containing protein [Amycolatopsis sp. NPDC023774]|uniref:DUF6461 domain-containing protein n=1 Tax=Amycolatopsis sp. NPDC023774 TaxID=3155015 RepID=UPI00340C4882